jgi:hypothetical protein
MPKNNLLHTLCILLTCLISIKLEAHPHGSPAKGFEVIDNEGWGHINYAGYGHLSSSEAEAVDILNKRCKSSQLNLNRECLNFYLQGGQDFEKIAIQANGPLILQRLKELLVEKNLLELQALRPSSSYDLDLVPNCIKPTSLNFDKLFSHAPISPYDGHEIRTVSEELLAFRATFVALVF